MTATAAEKQTKNKELTKQKILTAVEEILATEGYRALGINRVAKAAGIGKTLIYRYFGGLEGLLEAYGNTDRFWPTLDEIRGLPEQEFRALSLKERCRCIFRNFREALRSRPHTVAIYAWEMAENNAFAQHLGAVRAQTSIMLVKEMVGQHERKYSEYDQEITAILGAGLLHLIVREHFDSPFAGLELQDDETWERIDGALDLLFSGLVARYKLAKLQEENAGG